MNALLSGEVVSQELDNIRTTTIQANRDTIQYDTLATVAGSMQVLDPLQQAVDHTEYTVLPWKSMLVVSEKLQQDHSQLVLKYRILPASLSESYFHKNIEQVGQIPERVFTWQKISRQKESRGPLSFASANIIQSGSISRALSIGNNQDAVVNSGMDLQLSGELTNNLSIRGVLSDRNVPIQPDGTTQQIKELDRVFLEVYNDQTRVTGGDFEISNNQGYFMRLNKKVQGARVRQHYQPLSQTRAVSSVSGAISRGRHCTKRIQGEEGNQGPYHLTGCKNEPHIIILSGSERVYINGQLMKRGKNHDYLINYNTAEITFTPNQPITKDKRIRVEFEYSMRTYNRFLAFTQNRIKTNSGSLWLNVFTQKDSKNQTLAQDLTTHEKRILSRAGDDMERAVVPYVDTTGYNNDMVLYRRQDTVVGGKRYSIYRRSTHPQKARLKVGFSYAGENRGNYVLKKSAANGRVYQWVAPVEGKPQGRYTPMRQLVAPRQQQMLTFGGSGKLTSGIRGNFEMALSNHDRNTFSSLDQADNKGYALHLDLDRQMLARDTSRAQLITSLSYRGVHKNFTPIERFRAVEFDRNWNLRHRKVSGHEHLVSGGLRYWNHQLGQANYQFEYLGYQNGYQGYRNRLNTNLQHASYQLELQGNLLKTRGRQSHSDFIRYKAHLSKHFSALTAGIQNKGEYNTWQGDTLMGQSFAFNQWKFYLKSPDSLTNQYFMNYQIRHDQRADANRLRPANTGRDFNIGVKIHSLEKQTFQARITYRRLTIADTSLSPMKPEDHLLGRIEHSMHLFNNLLSSSTHLEVGSGLQPRKEYTYIEVSDGQGVYTWTDYNDNNVKELDEFEKARFQDQADYLRLYRPTGEYYQTHTHGFNQVINLNPGRAIGDTSWIGRLASRFSNQLAFRIRRKNRQDHFWKNLNPFAYSIDNPDVLSQSSNLKNTLSFNKNHANYRLDYIFLKSQNKSLMMNGSKMTHHKKQGLHVGVNLTPSINLLNKASLSQEGYRSEFFDNRNYRLQSLEERFSFKYQPSSTVRGELTYEFADINNQTGPEAAVQHRVDLKVHFSRVQKFRLQGEFSFIHFRYGARANTPIAYQMLEGLKPGQNGVWRIMFQKEVYKNLELNINYSGRTSRGKQAIHSGQVELRANF